MPFSWLENPLVPPHASDYAAALIGPARAIDCIKRIEVIRLRRIISAMYTIIELPTFSSDAKSIWDEAERGAFCAWLVDHPLAGDVIPGSGGCQGALGAFRHGQARRCAGDLFQPAGKGRDLPDGDLRQGGARQHSGAFAQSHSGDD